MRKFLVRNFVLDYRGNYFGWKYNAPRASRIIYPLMVVTGYFAVTNPDYPNPTVLVWILYALLATSLFFGFVYFRFYPAKWEELDDYQKFQYGIFKAAELSREQYVEWVEISNNLNPPSVK
jgi:hypothetical protein